MKLPPLALTAPSLCPRCDAAAMFLEECTQCALPLRQCGSCLGVAGPFDRYCGFCGHELVLGEKRSGAWRLWLAVAMVPILVALAIGLSPLGQQAARSVRELRSGSPPAKGGVTDTRLRFQASLPAQWTFHDPGAGVDLAIMSADAADQSLVDSGPGALLTAVPQGPVVELGVGPAGAPGVDPNNPVAVLTAQVTQLTASTASGYKLAVAVPVRAIVVDGRPAAQAVLAVTSPSGGTLMFERVYVSVPRGGLFMVQSLTPAAGLTTVTQVLNSLRLT